MLASTMQFSTNNQPTTHTTHTSHHHTTDRYANQAMAGTRKTTTPQRLFPQDPTGCSTPHQPHHNTVPTPHKTMAVLDA